LEPLEADATGIFLGHEALTIEAIDQQRRVTEAGPPRLTFLVFAVMPLRG
jgi:hypothetical protein